MNFLKKIKPLMLLKKKKLISPVVDSVEEISMKEREDKVYGEGGLSLQKLYEKWSCKEDWLLYEEGIPLLLGIEPGNKKYLEDDLQNKIEELWAHAQDCVHKKLLSVLNNDMPELEWKVKPVDLYCWASVSRITIPAELSSLMAFVVQTIKTSDINSTSVQTNEIQDDMHQKHKEIVLGAATSLLVNAPELCKNKKGRVVSRLITKQILENETQWFGDDKPLLAESAMIDLIDGYLRLTRPVL
jgi:hypothetical protein